MRTILPYNPSAKDFGELSKHQSEQLSKITPSIDRDIEYYPCQAKLKDGEVIDNVYIIDAQSYINIWGVWPSDDGKKFEIPRAKLTVQAALLISSNIQRVNLEKIF